MSAASRPSTMLRLAALLLAAQSSLALRTAPFPRHAARAMSPVLKAEDDGVGVGFGTSRKYTEEEERGRKALEKLRDASTEKGYDSSLQGLKSEDEDPVEVPEEFKSQVILGFAGFLIVGGVISLLIGGSLWEPSDSAPVEDTPAFGFVPKAVPRPDLPPPASELSTW
mmetsp:Transcript_15082/g.31734  ORF Transcript_15082/g.31734 Transcript_15082/m.31734 type:complete len:168 (+) Transcript_15082:6-509(+)